MKSKLAVAVCVIGMVAIWVMGLLGVAIAGNLDTGQACVGSDDGVVSTDSLTMEPEAAVGPPARVEKTGQTTSRGPRDDGALRRGVAWPKPRFTEKGDGTVRDNLTGLIWLVNANCEKFWDTDTIGRNNRGWDSALVAANKLGDGYCGLSDGSKAGNWRLPNRKELESLIDCNFLGPALPNTVGTGKWTEGDPFSGVELDLYWSSTAVANKLPATAWVVHLASGEVHRSIDMKDTFYVWPVRGGEK